MVHAPRTAAVAVDESALVDPPREFAFSDADFRSLAQLAHDQAGIALADSKRNLVYSRLSRRLRALRLTSFREYREYLDANPSELESFINAISTNLTKFFRESHHFDHLRTHVAVPFAQTARGSGGNRLRVWSAGCSTGEEPYTIAVVLRREIRDIERQDVRILATDIDTEVLAKAARGEYAAGSIDDVPKTYREYFQSAGRGDADKVIVADEVRSLITFRRFNLMRAVAVQRQVRRHLLPERHDLFRWAHQDGADRSLHPADQARRLALHRPFRIADRNAPRPEIGRPHDLSERGVTARNCHEAGRPAPAPATVPARAVSSTPRAAPGW